MNLICVFCIFNAVLLQVSAQTYRDWITLQRDEIESTSFELHTYINNMKMEIESNLYQLERDEMKNVNKCVDRVSADFKERWDNERINEECYKLKIQYLTDAKRDVEVKLLKCQKDGLLVGDQVDLLVDSHDASGKVFLSRFEQNLNNCARSAVSTINTMSAMGNRMQFEICIALETNSVNRDVRTSKTDAEQKKRFSDTFKSLIRNRVSACLREQRNKFDEIILSVIRSTCEREIHEELYKYLIFC